ETNHRLGETLHCGEINGEKNGRRSSTRSPTISRPRSAWSIAMHRKNYTGRGEMRKPSAHGGPQS
ncbi:hypothetical protein HAX54_034668, partial [Datura stramonium]|nr:hypothetical protein [Datura stramonium]